jgi:AAT family amino acid transporter
LIWHHYFDDIAFGLDKDAWSAFFVRTVGVLLFAAGSYWVYYYTGFGHSVLGNHHMEEFAQGFSHGESLIWNFWWIIPLLWNEWFFHKWPFYVYEK